MKFMYGTMLTLGATIVAVISDVDSTQPQTSAGVTNVASYGAIANDGKDDTVAVQRALAACAGSPRRTLYFPGGRFHLSSLTFRKDVSVHLANGTRLELEQGEVLRVNGPFRAGLYQVFSGTGDVHFGAGAVSEILPQWWGASAASSDSSPAINRAINSAPDLPGVNIRLSGLFHCRSTIHVNRHRVKLVGDGMYATRITFNPTSPKALFEFSHADKSVLAQCTIRDMGLLGAGNYEDRDRVQKVGIKIVDADILEVRNIAIHNWGGNQSIGLQVQGRELVFVENITILADLPILIDKNPGLDWI
ncbi:MAG: hypothetical protein CMJ75_10545, partial [Planctomycetaceae bacterium]|nr:hypothetical protein [Planctomycetaceae bacterium]